jgi:hypothetical protein
LRWAELVLDYLRALIWPAVVLFIVLKFRKQLGELLGRLRKADALGFAMDFDGSVTKAATALSIAESVSHSSGSATAQTEEGLSEGEGSDEPSSRDEINSHSSIVSSASSFNEDVLDQLLALAVNHRFQAIDQAWKLVRRTADRVDEHVGFTEPDMLGLKSTTMWRTIEELERLGAIGPEIRKSLDELEDARNNAWDMWASQAQEDGGHSGVSLAAATTFITTAYRLADAIKEAGERAYYKVHPV